MLADTGMGMGVGYMGVCGDMLGVWDMWWWYVGLVYGSPSGEWVKMDQEHVEHGAVICILCNCVHCRSSGR